MMSRFLLLFSIFLVLTLPACQLAYDGATAEDEAARETLAFETAVLGEEPAASVVQGDTDKRICKAEPVQELIGQRVTDKLVTRALKDSGAAVSRVLGPTDAATLDLSPTRLNIITDTNGVIQTLHCG